MDFPNKKKINIFLDIRKTKKNYSLKQIKKMSGDEEVAAADILIFLLFFIS